MINLITFNNFDSSKKRTSYGTYYYLFDFQILFGSKLLIK